MDIQIINGPNLNLLGKREPSIYGSISFEKFLEELKKEFCDLNISYFQSNTEGEIIDFLQKAGFESDGILLNAGAYTHTSIAIRDAISSIKSPVVEIHLSNVYSREDFRKTSFIAPVCKGCIAGFGLQSYRLGILYFISQNGKV